jgi:hypothetical protein
VDQSVISPAEPERWRPVVGWEGVYEVSSLGRIRKLLPQDIRPTLKGAYLAVTLRGPDGRSLSTSVHSLVAEAFIGPRPAGEDVCHGPAGHLDNSVANLSYGTHAKNCGPDRYRDGTILLGTRVATAKLTEEIVRECRARVAAGESKADLAREFGVSKTAIIFAVRGDTWRHVI